MVAAGPPIAAVHPRPQGEAHRPVRTGSRTGGDRTTALIRAALAARIRAPDGARAPDLTGPPAADAKALPGRTGPPPAAGETPEPTNRAAQVGAIPALHPRRATPPAGPLPTPGPASAAPPANALPALDPAGAAPSAGPLPAAEPASAVPPGDAPPATAPERRRPEAVGAVPPPGRTQPSLAAGKTPEPTNRAASAGETPDLPARPRQIPRRPRQGAPAGPGRLGNATLRSDRALMTGPGSTARIGLAQPARTRMSVPSAAGLAPTRAPPRAPAGLRAADVTAQPGASPPTAAAGVRAPPRAQPSGDPDPASTPNGAAWLAKEPAPCPTLRPAAPRLPTCGEKRSRGPGEVISPKMGTGPRMRSGSRKLIPTSR